MADTTAADFPELHDLKELVTEGNVTIRLGEVTPAIAESLLARNVRNRKTKAPTIAALVEDLEYGRWYFNGDAIRISDTGTLLDGQHRLKACVEAKVGFRALVVSGLPGRSQQTMDIGARRSIKDALDIQNESCTTMLAAMIRTIGNWETHGILFPSVPGAQMRPNQALALLDRYQDLREEAKMAQSQSSGGLALTPLGMSYAVWYSLRYVVNRTQYKGSWDQFESGFVKGYGLADGDPRATLRDLLHRDKAAMESKLSSIAKANLLVRCWSDCVFGQSVTKYVVPMGINATDAWIDIPDDKIRLSKQVH